MTDTPRADTLPCVTNWQPFDAVINMHEQPSRRHGTRGRNTIQAARAICETCGVRDWCLRAFPDGPGIIAGLTFSERDAMGLVAS